MSMRHPEPTQAPGSLNRLALSATVHCLTGCAIGEVLGMILSTWWGWGNAASIALSIVLAFFFGYGFTSPPFLRANMSLPQGRPPAPASGSPSITHTAVASHPLILSVAGRVPRR